MSACGTSVRRLWRHDAKHLRRVLLFALVSGVILHEAVVADERSPSRPSATITFNLPPQSLDAAIERYSIASGWQIIYDANLANARWSERAVGGHRLRSTAAAGQEIALELDTVANQTVRPPALAQHQ